MNIDVSEKSTFNNLTIMIDTPEGRMFVSIIEDEGKPIAIDIKLGKAGLALTAWAHTFARIMTLALEHGATIQEFIQELSSQRAERSRTDLKGIEVTSGPEGVCYALMQYSRDRFETTRKLLGIEDDDDAERQGRGPRMAR